MRPRLFHLLGGIFFSLAATAQTLSRHAVMFSADYASNSEVLGTFSNAAPQPSWSPSVSFLSKWGIDFSMNGYAIGNSDDSLEHFTGELDLMAGYNFEPVKGLVLYPSYTRFFHTENSNALKSIFSNDFHLDVDYTWKFINLGVSSGYFTGQQHTFYAALHNNYLISFNRIFGKKDALSLQPGIDLNFGDYEYLNLYYLGQLENNQTYLYYLMLNPVIRRYVFEERQKNPSLTREDILIHYLEIKAADQLKFTSVGLSLPVSYMFGNFSLNAGIYAFIPVNQPDYLGSDVQFFYNIGISYLIFSGK
jgi:hypothetical protein